MNRRPANDWGFEDLFPREFLTSDWANQWRSWAGRRRTQIFESGEMKFVILRLLQEKPRHGYDVIKALEEKMRGYYTPSAGTVYPTLQLLEDQSYVRSVEADGRKVFHITPDGEHFLSEHRDVVDEIFERARDVVRDFAAGPMADLNGAFARLASATYKRAWRKGPENPAITRVTAILQKATEDIDRIWSTSETQP